jgi:hypothetical protein
MEPYFESEPPFIVKVYDKHFEITWEGALDSPDNRYSFKDVAYLKIVSGERERTIGERIFDLFVSGSPAKRVAGFDEVLIIFRNNKHEVRYVHGQVRASVVEAIEMINAKLNQREFKGS